MAWNSKEEPLTKEKIIELMGTDPAALATKMNEMGVSFEELKTKLSSVDAIKESLARLEGRLPKEEVKTTVDDTKPQFATVFEDEDAAINGRVDAKLGPILNLSINTNAEMAYNNFKASKQDFGIFEKEIRDAWDKVPINQKVNAQQLIKNLYFLKKGEKVDTDAPNQFFVEGGSNNGGSRQRTDDGKGKTPEERATDKDKEMAGKWGIPVAEYMTTKESMKFV
jgi:hypothetical protein